MTFQITTLTPASVQQNLQNDGLNALGLTSVRLSPRWAATTPGLGDYDTAALTLNITGDIHAPFLGIREFAFQPVSSTLASAILETATTITVARRRS